MTSPVSSRSKQDKAIPPNSDEFDLSWIPPAVRTTTSTTSPSSNTTTTSSTTTLHCLSNQVHTSPGRRPLTCELKLPRPVETGIQSSENKASVSTDGSKPSTPVSMDIIPHFALYTEITRMSTTLLCRIKQVLEVTPSTSPLGLGQKLWAGQHLYSMLVVYGSSSWGRTRLVDTLACSNPFIFSKVLVSTTRKRRAKEENGIDFHFISHKEMSRSISQGDFLEYTTIHKKRGSTPLQRCLCSQKPSLDQESLSFGLQ